jgi:hypothetical protein
MIESNGPDTAQDRNSLAIPTFPLSRQNRPCRLDRAFPHNREPAHRQAVAGSKARSDSEPCNESKNALNPPVVNCDEL